MPAWLPLLKASLPYITQIVSAAVPHFTSKSPTSKPEDIVPKQISELQTAVTDNAKSVQELAAQLRQTIEGIDAAAGNLQRELRLIRRLAGAALIIALLALGMVAATMLTGCVATQEDPPSKQAAAYVKQLGEKLRLGTPLQAAIAEVESQGFKCREAAARPMPMGHTIVCAHATPQPWGVVLSSDNEAKLTAVRSYERTASRN